MTPPISVDTDKIDTIFQPIDRCDTPGMAVGISIGGDPVYRKGFGLASMELPCVLSPTMRMRIASMSKHFACFAYLLLCERGNARIDDTVGAHLSDIHPVVRDVTVRQLMGHTSGIRDAADISWQFSGIDHPVTSDQILDLYRSIDDVSDPPETTWRYNNGAYTLLSKIIERIAKQTLAEFLSSDIFKPVGMVDTLLRPFNTDFLSNSATLHTSCRDGGFSKTYLVSEADGMGGVVTTVGDMLRWMRQFSKPSIGSTASWSIMTTPMVLNSGASTNYAAGLVIDSYAGHRTISHTGGILGGNAHMVHVPEFELDVVVIGNRDDVLAVSLADSILQVLLPPIPQGKTVETSLPDGVFISSRKDRVVQLARKDGVQIATVDGMDLPVESDSQGTWRPSGVMRFVRQAIRMRGEANEGYSLEFDDFGTCDTLSPMSNPDAGEIKLVQGRFRSDSTESEIHIDTQDAPYTMRSFGRFGNVEYALQHLGPGFWQFKSLGPTPFGGIVRFENDYCTLTVTTARNRALIFKRTS